MSFGNHAGEKQRVPGNSVVTRLTCEKLKNSSERLQLVSYSNWSGGCNQFLSLSDL